MIRKVLLAICLSCAMLVTVAALVLVLQDANEYKAEIETWLSTQVGSEVSIEGEVNLSIYPWLGLRMERVRIESPLAFGDEPLVKARGAVVRMRLGPLVRDRDIVLDRLVLDRPVITLRRFADGRANWRHMLRSFGVSADEEPPSMVQAPPDRPHRVVPRQGWSLKAERMHGVSIVDGRVQYVDDATNEYLVVDQFYLETGPGAEFDYEMRFRVDESVSGLAGIASLKGTCILDSFKPSLTTRGAEFSFQGAASYSGETVSGTVAGALDLDTASGRVALHDATADMDILRAEFSVESPLPLGGLPVTGEVRLTVRDVNVITRIWREVLEEESLKYLQGLTLRTAYRVETERVRLEGMQVEAAGMAARGSGELLLGDAPRVSILLDMETLALEELLHNGGSLTWLNALVDAGELPDLGVLGSLRLGIDAGAVSGFGLDLRRLSMDLDMTTDRLTLDLGADRAFGGTLNGSLEITPESAHVSGAVETLSLAELAGVLR
ncbi:MAG: AsmA family protein, partial [Oceanidesulfovibrio sp.]